MDVRSPASRRRRACAAAGAVGLAVAVGGLAGPGAGAAAAAGLPAAPTIDSATSPAPGEVDVAFTPGSANGATVTGYELAFDGGNGWWTAFPTTDAGDGHRLMVLTGQPQGMTMYLSLRATTADGPGEKSSPVQQLTVTSAAPGHPQPLAPAVSAVSDTPGAVALTVMPGYDNGRTVQGWEVSTDGGTTWGDPLTGDFGTDGTVRLALAGQPEGAVLQIEVRAVTSDGVGIASSPAQQVTVRSAAPAAPGTPSGVSAQARAAQIAVAWSAPSAGGPVDHYEATLTPGGQRCSTTTLSCLVGASAGTSYTVTVVAVSAAGVVGPGASVAVAGTVATPTVPASVPAAALPLSTDRGAISAAVPGEQITVVGTGYLPYSSVEVVIYSTPVVLGTVVTDGTGSFSRQVAVPAGLASGQHHLVTSGVGPDGAQRFLRMDLTVRAAHGAPGELAWTGFAALPWALTGAGLIAAGGAALLASRRGAVRTRA